MRFMVIVMHQDTTDYEAGKMPDPKLLETMGKFNEELVNAGVMLSGDGLHPTSKGARVHFPGKGKPPVVTQGPFTDSQVAGFWMWQVKSKEEALEWAKRAPMEDGATLELRQVFELADFAPDIEQRNNQLRDKIKQQNR